MRKIVFTAIVILAMMLLTACGGDSDVAVSDAAPVLEPPVAANPTPSPQPILTPEPTIEVEEEPAAFDEIGAEILTFGSTFEFDGFEVTIGTTYEWTTVVNRFSEFDGHDVVAVPIDITNMGDETATLRNPTIYGPDGIRLGGVSAFFRDYSPPSMRPGATATAYLHFLYTGDGEYWLEFSRIRDRVEIMLSIIR